MFQKARTPSDPAVDWLSGIADPIKLAVVRALARAGAATVTELADACGASVGTVRRHLAALTASGVVTEESGSSDGFTAGRPASRYQLPPSVLVSVQELMLLFSAVDRRL
jgi:DNA-binding transcriptional ArsR family regulator